MATHPSRRCSTKKRVKTLLAETCFRMGVKGEPNPRRVVEQGRRATPDACRRLAGSWAFAQTPEGEKAVISAGLRVQGAVKIGGLKQQPVGLKTAITREMWTTLANDLERGRCAYIVMNRQGTRLGPEVRRSGRPVIHTQ